MKKLILFLSLILSVGFASAQSEIPSDSIRRAPSTNIKEFGGFLLDMGLMNVATPELPKFNLEMPNMTKDYNQLFRLNTDVTYSQGFTDSFSFVFFLRLFWLWLRIWLGTVFFSTVYADGVFQTEKRNENQYLRRL